MDPRVPVGVNVKIQMNIPQGFYLPAGSAPLRGFVEVRDRMAHRVMAPAGLRSMRFKQHPGMMSVVTLDVDQRTQSAIQVLRKANYIGGLLRDRGVPVSSARIIPPRVERLWKPTKAGFAHSLPGFGQAEEVVAEATERSFLPQIVAAGSIGVIALGLVYAMGKETIGRAY